MRVSCETDQTYQSFDRIIMVVAGFFLTAGMGLFMVSLVSSDVIYDVTSGDVANYTLPSNFLFGAGSSNYQIEGAWNVSGKGESVLDYGYNHNSRFTATGNEACDSYYLIDEDIEMIRQLQHNVYRFSLSWARIFPNGTRPANADGVRYYKELIRKLRSISVEPLITLYHFDHPRALEEQFHSWQNETMIDIFVDFADFAFETFGENVTYWTTINEANQYCNLVYYDGRVPPGDESETGIKQYYICMRNMILAHGKVYRVYEEKYASTQKGKVGFSCLTMSARPASTTEADSAASIRANDFAVGACAEPVIFGDWPSSVKSRVIDQLVEEYNLTSLYFTEQETKMLTDSTDYMGLNIYGGIYVAESSSSSDATAASGIVMGFFTGANVTLSGGSSNAEGWPMEDSVLLVKNSYNDLPVFITENGLDTASEGVDDTSRATYASEKICQDLQKAILATFSASVHLTGPLEIIAYAPNNEHKMTNLRALAGTINSRNASVIGYTMWSLLDDFEYSQGYKLKYGMVHVDFDSVNKTRTLKSSSKFFTLLQSTKVVPAIKESKSAGVLLHSSSISILGLSALVLLPTFAL